MMKQASGNNMGVIARRGGHQKRPTAHNFVADERHQHRMFDVVVERVAVADTVKCKPGKSRNEFCQSDIRRSKPAVQLLGEVGAQSVRRQFRYGNQRTLLNFWTDCAWLAKTIPTAKAFSSGTPGKTNRIRNSLLVCDADHKIRFGRWHSSKAVALWNAHPWPMA